MPPRLKGFLQRWAIDTVAVLMATHIVRGIHYDTPLGLLVATLVLGILNAVIRPVLLLLSLPLVIFTLGLFTLVINAVLLYFVGFILTSFHVDTFGAALLGALVISLVSLVLNLLTGGTRVEIRKGRRPPPDQPGGGGPVIDV